MSEALEDLAVQVYGEEGATRFFVPPSEADFPGWEVVAKAPDTWTLCGTKKELLNGLEILHSVELHIASIQELMAEAPSAFPEKFAGVKDYRDAVNRWINRSLGECACEPEGVMH